MSNYRPGTLLSWCCNVLEHFAFKHIVTALEDVSFFVTVQNGIQRGYSTLMVRAFDGFAFAIDGDGQVNAVSLNFTKAFDRVSPHELLFRLRYIPDNDHLVRWLDSYLTNRKTVSKYWPCSTLIYICSFWSSLGFYVEATTFFHPHQWFMRRISRCTVSFFCPWLFYSQGCLILLARTARKVLSILFRNGVNCGKWVQT